MIFGNPYKFALYIDKFFYLEEISDWDCMCGYFINGIAYISDHSQLLYTQTKSIENGALTHLIKADHIFKLPLAEAFKELLKHRYPNFLGLTEQDFLESEWVEPQENYQIYDAALESSNLGTERYSIFVIGSGNNVRIISYKKSHNYFNLEALNTYFPVEVYITNIELGSILEQLKTLDEIY